MVDFYGELFYYMQRKWPQFCEIEYCVVAVCCKGDFSSGMLLKREWSTGKTKSPHLTNTVGTEDGSVGESQSLGQPEKAGSFLECASRENCYASVNIVEDGYGNVMPMGVR